LYKFLFQKAEQIADDRYQKVQVEPKSTYDILDEE
jgi:hypothetical protein